MIPMNDLRRGVGNSLEIIGAVERVISSGHWVHGPEHKAFESEFADYLGVDYVIGVASGTDALELALRAIGCGAGSKVITVANAGGYVSVAAATIGCEVVFCDVDQVNLLMDPVALESLLSREIQAVVVTHLYGSIAPISRIKNLCNDYGVAVIEDCAQAVGGIEGNHRVGTIGDIGTFSFYPTKNLGGIGDGGAIATNDLSLANKLLKLRQYGWGKKYEIDIEGGKNSRLDEIQAAVLRVGLRFLDEQNKKRFSILAKYKIALSDTGIELITSIEHGSAPHLAVLKLPVNASRDNFRGTLLSAGIMTDVHYPILDIEQSGLVGLTKNYQLPNTVNFNTRIVTLPLFPEMTPQEVELICDNLKTFSAC